MKQLLIFSILFVAVFSYPETYDGLGGELKKLADEFKQEMGVRCQNVSKSDAVYKKLTDGTESLIECLDGIFEFLKFNESEKLSDAFSFESQREFEENCPKLGQGLECLNTFLTTSAKDCLDADKYEYATELIGYTNTTITFACHNNGERVKTLLTEIDETSSCLKDIEFSEFVPCVVNKIIVKSFYDILFNLDDDEKCDTFDILSNCTTNVMKTRCPGKKTPTIVEEYFDAIKSIQYNCGDSDEK